MTENGSKDVAFLLEAARYFENRPTRGEDRAHWSNVYNAENCRRIAELISRQNKEDAMSKIGNHRVEMQESDDYQFGRESAERGEPMPDWNRADERCQRQILGWRDYHDEERSQ